MAFAETRGSRLILQGIGPTEVTLAGNVFAGDCLGYDSGWKLSASATTIQPILIAATSGSTGQRIKAYMMALIECKNILANVGTVGEKVALNDSGEYVVAGAGLPDVGFTASIGADSLSAQIFVNPTAAQLTVPRS